MAPPGGDQTRRVERSLGTWARARLPAALTELAMFVLKQAWACLFGGLMLAAILLSRALWQEGWPIHRYDALLVFAVALQVAFLRFRLETWAEARVILLFHLTGTAMEWFKVDAGSWSYPEPGLFKVLNVPLFSGFMYAAVGSYMARVIRIFEMRFAPYPPFWATMVLAGAIYANFFVHHFLPDGRFVLMAASLVLYWRTRIWFRVTAGARWMPLPLAAFLSALALWLAENIGTATGTWLYYGQGPQTPVSYAKIGSWYLLLYVSFVTVTLAARDLVQDQRNPRQ